MSSVLNALNQNPNSRLAELKLVIMNQRSNHKKVIVVEGDDDKQLFQRLYDQNHFFVYCSSRFPGCLDFCVVCDRLNTRYSEFFIMIKDADFDVLNGVDYRRLRNFFLTDRHDLETMVLRETFLNAIEERYGCHILMDDIMGIMHDIRHLSYIKWMNNVQSLRLKLKKKGKASCCYTANGCVDIQNWIDSIRQDCANDSKVIPACLQVREFEESHPLGNFTIWELTNGHDLIQAISQYLQARIHRNVAQKTISGLLINSFTYQEYQQTNLYRNIERYCNS